MIVWVFLLFFAVVLYDGLTLLKTAKKLEKGVYFVMMAIGFALLTLYSLEITVPSPTDAITKVLDAILHIKK